MFPKIKVYDDSAKATGHWKAVRITVKLTIQDRPRLRQYPLPPPSSSKLSNNGQETKKKKKLSTMEIPLSKRLTTLLNRCSPDLSLENSVEPLKKSWGAPSLWAAMLMAATLAMTSTVVQGMPS